ncbi:MAG: MBL fold metallo-hydrolase [Ectothiorhodospiraceae bacterium]|nr:MBL fold metallo-hydrolase [Chromatiales bacterium]MCP5156460.1 MBL fold metallo-hydrolase [Ectothiorhodospiraceae bacterium]
MGGNTPCVELRVGDDVIILDAGTGIIPLGNALVREDGVRSLHVVLSHYHWDHISGLPFFVPAFIPGWSIDFYGPAESPAELAHHISQQMKAPYFPVETETWLADVRYHVSGEQELQLGDVRISHTTMHHPGLTYAYRIEVDGRVIVYAPDNELAFISQSIDARREEFDEDEQPLLEAMKQEQHWRGIEFMEDADVLIHDAQYTPEDYRKKRGWGHSCYLDTVRCALDARVKDLRLFSHDPNNDDVELDRIEGSAMELVSAHQSRMTCRLAREGVQIDLDSLPRRRRR